MRPPLSLRLVTGDIADREAPSGLVRQVMRWPRHADSPPPTA
jgi:hypothetical protein